MSGPRNGVLPTEIETAYFALQDLIGRAKTEPERRGYMRAQGELVDTVRNAGRHLPLAVQQYENSARRARMVAAGMVPA